MNRRQFLVSSGLVSLGAGSFALCAFWPDEGLRNPCNTGGLPEHLANHELIQAAWDGLDSTQIWDCHVHLIGIGDGDSKIWINPAMQSLWNPMQYIKFQFYLNASCLSDDLSVDRSFVERLLHLHDDFKSGSKLMLLAFDYFHDQNGNVRLDKSSFYTPNAYTAGIARKFPKQFEWIASIHPYRKDCVEALEWAVKNGARAVKWLPPAMGIDPSSVLCDPFYEAMAKHGLPLLTHAGKEMAVHGEETQRLGNPLLLRRPLEHKIRIVVAHCASLGNSVDIDKGENAPKQENFELFSRMMDEPRYENLLFGELSAILQINRVGTPIETIIQRSEWGERFVNGSDYPLTGVMPLFSIDGFVERGYITQNEAKLMSQIRKYNALLFDFVVKRRLKFAGKTLSIRMFESKRVFSS